MLTDLCIYTIKHSEDLRASFARGGSDTYTERKKWARAKRLLDKARSAGERLPIVFAPAEATRYLLGWALLEEVAPGETTAYTFSELRLFTEQLEKITLCKASNGEPLESGFIRPYAICRTPSYLSTPLARKGRRGVKP